MLSTFLLSFIIVSQNQEVPQKLTEMVSVEKMENLNQLVTLLSIALFTMIVLLTLNLFKAHKMKKEITELKSQLNSN